MWRYPTRSEMADYIFDVWGEYIYPGYEQRWHEIYKVLPSADEIRQRFEAAERAVVEQLKEEAWQRLGWGEKKE